MTATTRSAECRAPETTLLLAFDLGSTKWTLGFTTAPAPRPPIRTMPAGHVETLVKEIQLAKARFGLPLGAPVRSCYEAGRDGFWLHRWLRAHEIENVVVDASSIEVNRRARRAKTDRLDVSKLLALLLRWHGGERHVWSVVHVPSPEAEAQRQVTREITTVREDRKRVRNRIQALLATQGIRLTLDATFLAHLATAQTGDGRALPTAFRLRLEREWAHLAAIDTRMRALAAARDAAIETGTDRVAAIARRLCTRRGVAETSAAVFSAELFGTRTFQNGRQVGAVMGWVPVPYRSDQRVRGPGAEIGHRPVALCGARGGAGGRHGEGVAGFAAPHRLCIHWWRAARACGGFLLDGNRLIDGAACPFGPAHACSWCVIADRGHHG
jgi:transposase